MLDDLCDRSCDVYVYYNLNYFQSTSRALSESGLLSLCVFKLLSKIAFVPSLLEMRA